MTAALPFHADNRRIADRLLEAASLLQSQGASPYRIAAYRHAAESIAHHPRDVRRLYQADGVRGLDGIPRVGLGIASAVAQMLATGRWTMLERLRGSADPAKLLQSVPGVGPELARRMHDGLHIDSLEDFEAAVNDGRLEALPGVGARRAAAWRASLDEMLGRVHGAAPSALRDLPEVAVLLEVDREYREKAAEMRLPLLHTHRGPWHFTALFSNTARAQRLGRTRDWVMIFYYDGDHVERQCTVVTESHGALAGRRVVRGREAECLHPLNAEENNELHASHAA